MKKMLILIGRNPNHARGGASTWITNLEPYLKQNFEIEYLIIPEKWLMITIIPDRIKGLVQVFFKLITHVGKYDYIFSHSPELSWGATFFSNRVIHISHGNNNPMKLPTFRIGKIFYHFYEWMNHQVIKKAFLYYTVGESMFFAKNINQPIHTYEKPLISRYKKGIIFAGRLEAVKNVDRLIDIYNLLPDSIREIHHLYIYGRGSLQLSLEQHVCMNEASAYIHFCGHISNDELVKKINESAVLLMTSVLEGFPMTIAEALSVGTPVVSTDVGAINRVIKNGENGFVFSLSAENICFKDAIISILNNLDAFSLHAFCSSDIFNPQVINQQLLDDINYEETCR